MKNKIVMGIASIFIVAMFASCASLVSVKTATKIEMELSSSYDDSDPFINEKLFYVSDNAASVDLEVAFQMEAESGLLEIADNESKEVIWKKAWNDSADDKFSFSLNDLDKEKEYVIRLTCTKVKHAKLVLTSDSSLVKERERPQRPDKG